MTGWCCSLGGLPQLFDQAWHGRRVEALGAGHMVTDPAAVAAAGFTMRHLPFLRWPGMSSTCGEARSGAAWW